MRELAHWTCIQPKSVIAAQSKFLDSDYLLTGSELLDDYHSSGLLFPYETVVPFCQDSGIRVLEVIMRDFWQDTKFYWVRFRDDSERLLFKLRFG